MDKKVAKSGTVLGFAIAELVLLSFGTIAGLFIGCLVDLGGLALFAFQAAGVIVYSIFIAMYCKRGYEMNSIAYGVVDIVFAFFSWGVFSLVTGILILCLRGNKKNKK